MQHPMRGRKFGSGIISGAKIAKISKSERISDFDVVFINDAGVVSFQRLKMKDPLRKLMKFVANRQEKRKLWRIRVKAASDERIG